MTKTDDYAPGGRLSAKETIAYQNAYARVYAQGGSHDAAVLAAEQAVSAYRRQERAERDHVAGRAVQS